MRPLIFICGALRSGSTMFHLMLNSHPKIDHPGEFDFLFDKINDDGTCPDIKEFHDWLRNDRIFLSHNLQIDETLSVPELIKSFVSQLKKSDKVLALNIHRNFYRIPYIFPEADYIHLIRDPRDVARSSIGMGWAGNVYYGVDHWVSSEESWLKLLPQHKAKFYTLHYENLVSDCINELRKVCDYLEIPYSAAMLDYTHTSTYSAPNKKFSQQWKTKLSSEEVKLAECKAKTLMKKNGYKPVNKSNVQISQIKKLRLKLSDTAFKNSFALKRYGAYLYLLEKISRRFQIRPLYKMAVLQCAEVDKLYLR